jgi:hypothetical protein
MLGVGLPGITDTEGRTQFSLWVILGAPLFLGTDVRNMTAATLATVGNAEAIAINQDPLGVQGYQVDAGDTPTSYNGGVLLNLTACNPGSAPPRLGSMWILSGPDQQLRNANTSDCVATYDCGNTPQSISFAYQCVSNQCGNELYTFDKATGHIVSQVTPTPAQPLCLTAVDPSTSPFSQLIVDTCATGRADQQWDFNADGTLSVSLPSSPSQPLCLTEFSAGGSLYAKPLLPSVAPGATRPSQNIAIAVLNRLSGSVPGYFVDLTQFSFTPAQRVMVRDIWANQTLGPFAGNFTTRPLASHETILMRLYLV